MPVIQRNQPGRKRIVIQRVANVHPKTGRALEPIFVSEKTGRVYWPILGAAEDDSADDTGDSGDGGDDTGSGDDDTGSDGVKDDKSKSDDGAESDLKKQVSALTERMKAADKRADAAENKLKEIEDAKKDDLTKAKDKVAEYEASIKSLTEANQSLRLENAFALNGSFSWHDPHVVMDLVRKRDDVTIDEDGTVKGLDSALKNIAKDKPFLVKKESDEGDGLPATGRSGAGTTGNTGKDDKGREARVKKRFRI